MKSCASEFFPGTAGVLLGFFGFPSLPNLKVCSRLAPHHRAGKSRPHRLTPKSDLRQSGSVPMPVVGVMTMIMTVT